MVNPLTNNVWKYRIMTHGCSAHTEKKSLGERTTGVLKWLIACLGKKDILCYLDLSIYILDLSIIAKS
jgi:hypothetical protein